MWRAREKGKGGALLPAKREQQPIEGTYSCRQCPKSPFCARVAVRQILPCLLLKSEDCPFRTVTLWLWVNSCLERAAEGEISRGVASKPVDSVSPTRFDAVGHGPTAA